MPSFHGRSIGTNAFHFNFFPFPHRCNSMWFFISHRAGPSIRTLHIENHGSEGCSTTSVLKFQRLATIVGSTWQPSSLSALHSSAVDFESCQFGRFTGKNLAHGCVQAWLFDPSPAIFRSISTFEMLAVTAAKNTGSTLAEGIEFADPNFSQKKNASMEIWTAISFSGDSWKMEGHTTVPAPKCWPHWCRSPSWKWLCLHVGNAFQRPLRSANSSSNIFRATLDHEWTDRCNSAIEKWQRGRRGWVDCGSVEACSPWIFGCITTIVQWCDLHWGTACFMVENFVYNVTEKSESKTNYRFQTNCECTVIIQNICVPPPWTIGTCAWCRATWRTTWFPCRTTTWRAPFVSEYFVGQSRNNRFTGVEHQLRLV